MCAARLAHHRLFLSVKDLLLRKKTTVIFGKPIIIERKIEGVKDINAYYSDKIQDAFDALEQKN